MFSIVRRSLGAVVVIFTVAVPAASQDPVPRLPASPAQAPAPSREPATITGVVRRSESLRAIANATVIVENTSLSATTGADGRFSIANVPAGEQHVVIVAPGLMPIRIDVTVGATVPAPLDVLLVPEVHYTEVVSVSPNARDPFESYQPTSVLAGQELTKELESSLGATLEKQAGVSERSFGPGSSRPVIRGLDGDRVLILADGQRVGDLSSQSGDHGVTVNPASAARIEVVRGPATLLYGANAIGGLVNVISDTIPSTPLLGTHGALVADFGSAARDTGTALDMRWGNGRWAMHGSASGRRTSDATTPAGPVPNTQSRSGFVNFGIARTGASRYIGASYGYDDTKYGVPVIEEGQVELTPRRHVFSAKAGASNLSGLFEGVRADFASRRYRHDELVAGKVGTRFGNDTDELNVMLRHRRAGRVTGTIGVWALNRRFSALGEEALSPPVKERGVAAFFYEEVTWPHVTFQFGARVNRASFEPEQDLPARDFTDASGSIGLLFRPQAADDKFTLALSVARAARNPALEELYFFGPHPGNFAFEIGNAQLNSEKAVGIDVSARWRGSRISGELSYFRNSIADFILRNPLSREEFTARFGDDDSEEEGGEFGFIEFVAADSVLQGFEAHTDLKLAKGFGVEVGLDYVRGELRASNQPLPRIPPVRVRAGLTYQRNAFEAGGEIVAVSQQSRVLGTERPTAGYGNLRLFATHSFGTQKVVNTVSARIDNVSNELYRNHLSLIKDVVPEMGRNVKLIYSVRF